jgi:hypothetical protein
MVIRSNVDTSTLFKRDVWNKRCQNMLFRVWTHIVEHAGDDFCFLNSAKWNVSKLKLFVFQATGTGKIFRLRQSIAWNTAVMDISNLGQYKQQEKCWNVDVWYTPYSEGPARGLYSVLFTLGSDEEENLVVFPVKIFFLFKKVSRPQGPNRERKPK